MLREGLARGLLSYPEGGPPEALVVGQPGRLGSGESRLASGRWIRVSRSAARSGGTVVIWSDITPLKEREANLRVAKEQAEQANRAKTDFLANMGHELRTPLNAIIGFSELISAEAMGPVGTPLYRAYAGDIAASGQHLLAIINDILDMAHSEAGTLPLVTETVDLASLIEACRDEIARACAAAGHALSLVVAPDLPALEADPVRLRQVVHNLVSNAVRFTPEGGRVEIAAAAASDGGITLTVADTGIGMSAEDLAVALEPFRQVDGALSRRYEGTGLGLPLTKTLVELHEGTLRDRKPQGRRARASASTSPFPAWPARGGAAPPSPDGPPRPSRRIGLYDWRGRQGPAMERFA